MNEHPGYIEQRRYAFFFDIDGTLANIQATPEAVTIPPAVIKQLILLSKNSSGALAIVSGRPLSQIDALIKPLDCAAAGTHGAEIRTLQGDIYRVEIASDQLRAIEQQLSAKTENFAGILIEKKPSAFALHFRQAPSFEQPLFELATEIVEQYPKFIIQPGKFVWEIKPQQCDKGVAIKTLMDTEPFKGRLPVFIGDDITDEAGFRTVNQLQGLSIKVGAGKTAADCRLDSVEQLYQWLSKISVNELDIQAMRSV